MCVHVSVLACVISCTIASVHGAHLWVGVQDADSSGFNHLLYGVDLDSVQVALVLSVLQIASVLDVGVHLAAAGESKRATFALTLFGFS